MSIETNKATVRRYYEEVKNQGNLALLEELATPDYVEHNPIPGQEQGLAGLRQRAEMMARAFRVDITVEDMIAAGDRVVVRFTNHVLHQGTFMGLPATGKSATVQGIAVHSLQDSRIAERWILVDNFSLLMQLGAFPQPSAPGN
jgi:steroid delta-isomerase-like uncharacterized protein